MTEQPSRQPAPEGIDRRGISRAAGVLGGGTLLSRVAGLVRDMVIAGRFGAGFATDAFFMAFTLPNLLRRFFAEGSLTAAFVPTFSDVYHRQGEEKARRMVNICWTLLLLVMAGVVVAGVIGSPLLVRAIGFGFGAVDGKLALTDHLNRIMFPYIFLVSLLALLTGVLNVLGHYFLPAVSPLLLNLAIILCALFLAPHLQVPVTALAVGVLVGGAAQVLLQWPALRQKKVRLRLDFHFRDPEVVRVVKLMLPGIAGVAIYQINILVTRLLASFLPQGSVSYLYYGQRLFEFPQGLFVASLAQAVLPAMSRQAALDDRQGVKESLRFALVLIVLVTLPAAAGLMLCAVPVYSLFFMNGAFGYAEVQQTAAALAAYAPGLLFVGVSRVVVPTFYALQDTRTPVMISFWTFLVNALLGLGLMQVWGHVGLALALTLASVFNALVLCWALRRKIGPLGLGKVGSSLWRSLWPTLGMVVAVWGIVALGPWEDQGRAWMKSGVLVAAVTGGLAVYLLGCWLLRIPEARELVELLRRRLARGKRGEEGGS